MSVTSTAEKFWSDKFKPLGYRVTSRPKVKIEGGIKVTTKNNIHYSSRASRDKQNKTEQVCSYK